MIEQASIPIGRRFELVQKVSEQLCMKTIDLGDFLNPLRIIAMVRERMMRVGDADLRIDPHASLAAEHQGRNTSQVGLKCDNLKVVHQLRIIRKSYWYTGGLFDRPRHPPGIFLSGLDSALALPDRRHVFVQPSAI